MIRTLFGSGALGGGFSSRRMAGYLERSGFWAGDQGDMPPPLADGLFAGTLIATETGWQKVEDLRPGDRVVTFDSGIQPLRAVEHSTRSWREDKAPPAALPVELPAGALGNRRSVVLPPEQAVLIESDRAEELYGDPFTLVPAAALAGHRNIARCAPEARHGIVVLEFESDEIVYVEGMLLAQCPRRQPRLVTTADELIQTGGAQQYQLLPHAQSLALIASLPSL